MDPYSRMIDLMRTEGSAYNDYPLLVADVLTVAPLTIRYNDTDIPPTVGIWCPAEMIRIKDPTNISTVESGLKECLISLYQAFTIAPGDKVFAKRAGDKIFILGKAVGQ